MPARERSFLNCVLGNSENINRYPAVNRMIMGYLAVVVITYVLLLIAPFVTFISSTPLSRIRMYLGLLGAAMMVIDVFTSKALWHSPLILLLFGICISAGISTILYRYYGLKDNIFDLCWVIIQLILTYSLGKRLSLSEMKSFTRIVFSITLVIWFAACCVSLYQFAKQIGYRYYYNPNSDSPELCRQGFLQHRLFGVFSGLDYAAYVSLAHLAIGISYFIKSKRLFIRVLLIIALLPVFFHIVLSGSRSALVALLLYTFVFAWLLIRNRTGKFGIQAFLLKLFVAVFALVAVFGCYYTVKKTAVYIPPLMEKTEDKIEAVEQSVTKKKKATTSNTNTTSASTNETEQLQPDEDLLTRTEVQEDISNERFTIWKNYLSLYQEIGIFGLSLSNYNDYIAEHHSDLYIVQYFHEKLGDVDKSDLVYECHNNYLFIFVSTGWFGLACFLIFFIISFIRILRYILHHQRLSLFFITSLAIVGIGCIQALFMNSVFLKINAPSFLFWLAIGFVNVMIANKEEDTDLNMLSSTPANQHQ